MENRITLKECCIPNEQGTDYRRVGYGSTTKFFIQSGKGRKGAYVTRVTIVGDYWRARYFYDSLNTGGPYKKRLLMEGGKPKATLHRYFGGECL